MPKRRTLAFIVTIEIYLYSYLFVRNIDSLIQSNGIWDFWMVLPSRLSWRKFSAMWRWWCCHCGHIAKSCIWGGRMAKIRAGVKCVCLLVGTMGRGRAVGPEQGCALEMATTPSSPICMERCCHPPRVRGLCELGWRGCLIRRNKASCPLSTLYPSDRPSLFVTFLAVVVNYPTVVKPWAQVTL